MREDEVVLFHLEGTADAIPVEAGLRRSRAPRSRYECLSTTVQFTEERTQR